MKHIILSALYVLCFIPYLYMLLIPGAGTTNGFGEALLLQLLLLLLLFLSFVQVIVNLILARHSHNRVLTYGLSAILGVLIVAIVNIFSYTASQG